MYFACRALQTSRAGDFALCGLFSGLGYLTRPEAALVLVATGTALACFQWGLLCFRNKSLVRASDWLERAVALSAGNYWYQSFLAILKDRQELRDQALLHYGAAVALEPNSPWILFNRARLYRAKGWWDPAIGDMQGALHAFVARSRRPIPPDPQAAGANRDTPGRQIADSHRRWEYRRASEPSGTDSCPCPRKERCQ